MWRAARRATGRHFLSVCLSRPCFVFFLAAACKAPSSWPSGWRLATCAGGCFFPSALASASLLQSSSNQQDRPRLVSWRRRFELPSEHRGDNNTFRPLWRVCAVKIQIRLTRSLSFVRSLGQACCVDACQLRSLPTDFPSGRAPDSRPDRSVAHTQLTSTTPF